MIRCLECGRVFIDRAHALNAVMHECAKAFDEHGLMPSLMSVGPTDAPPPEPAAPIGMGRTGSARDPDEAHALSLAPMAKQIADYVKTIVPAGTDYGVFLVEKREGRNDSVIAVTTNRDRMVRYVASWVMETLERMQGKRAGRPDIVIGPLPVPWAKVEKVKS